MTDPKTCAHRDFASLVIVNRLEDQKAFNAEVSIKCSECGTPFRFLGLHAGLDLSGARVSVDGLEANLAICPKGQPAPQIKGVRGFDMPGLPEES
jgi:hypothetical protein